MSTLTDTLHTLARFIDHHDLDEPAALHNNGAVFRVQLCGLHDLVRWAIALHIDTATVIRGGDPDEDGARRTGWCHLHIDADLPTGHTAQPTIPVQLWAPVPQLAAGDLADGSTVANLGAVLAPFAIVA